MESWNEKLKTATEDGDIEALKLCLQNGADIDYQYVNGETALMSAAVRGHLEICRLLIERGCKIDTTHVRGWTALMTAAEGGHLEICRLLIDRGCKIDTTNRYGQTALMTAAEGGHLEICSLLIDTGCKIDITDDWGETALMTAAEGEYLEICRLLIDTGCKIDITNRDGRTALHRAAREGHLHITRCLVEQGGASLLIKTHEGQTPYDLAAANQEHAEGQYKEVMEYLQDRHARYEKKPGQRGLALIVNFMFYGGKKERKGSDEDCKNLTNFFKEELKYQVECTTTDMTKSELQDYFQEIARTYLAVNSKDYHSFICVIMSHGNEDGILTTNGFITVEEIKKPFKNKTGGKFNGKPKLFLIQACRGTEKQEKVLVSDCFETGHVEGYDEFPGNRQRRSSVETSVIKPGILDQPSASSEVLSTDAYIYSSENVPTDADIIVAYATTPGYISIRNMYEGAFFIRAFLSVAKNKYKEEHIEKILRNVRRELATNPEYAPQSGSLAGKCQMGIVETTYTKKFFL